MAEVLLKKVSKSFGTQTALADVSMEVPDGSFVVLLGPTGAGKTTSFGWCPAVRISPTAVRYA